MAGQTNWPGTPIVQQPAAPQSAAPPQLVQISPPVPNQPTPQAPSLEAHTNVETARTQQQTDQGDTGGHNATGEMQLHQQYRQDTRVQNYEAILPVYHAAQHAADTPAGDYDVVTAFAKITDPQTGIRQGEGENVEASATPEQRIQGLWNFYTQGRGRLTAETRAQLLAELAQRGGAMNNLYNAARADYQAQAQRYGFDPRAVTGEHAALSFRRQMGLPDPRASQDRGELTFWDDPARPPPAGAEDFQRDLESHLRSGSFTTPEQIISFANDYVGPDGQHHHFDIPLSQARAAINAGGRISVRPPAWAPLQGDPNSAGEQAGAAVRGVTDAATAGLDHPATAAFNTLAPESLGGNGRSFRENLALENSYDHYNQENHPWATLGGELAGSLAVPLRSGAEAAARSAAAEVLAGGGSRFEAVSAARMAASLRLGREGAAYGAVHGAATSDGDPAHAIANAAVETVMGFGTGRALGRFAIPNERAPSDLPPLVDPATGRLNQPLESASPAERVAAAQAHGIDMPLGAATDRGGAIIEKGLDVSPVSAGLMNDSRRTTEGQAASAVDAAADRYGTARTQYEGGTEAQAGARNWIQRATVAARDGQPSIVSKAYDAIPISPNAEAVRTSALATLDRLTSRFQSNPELAALEQNRQLVQYRDALANGALSWEDQKAFRSIIGDRIGAERFSDSPSRTDLRALYAALSEDMRATATAQGPRALRAFERANDLNRNVETRIESDLVPILGNDSSQHPERALQFIQNISRASKGNLDQLAAVRASLAKDGHWDNVASSLIRLGGQPADSPGRAFSPQTFLNWYSDMSEPARNLLFGGGSRAALRRNLDTFVEVAQRLAGTNALRNTSSTTPGMIGAGVVGSAGTAVWAGLMNPLTAVKASAGVAANYGLARLWTNPRFVQWATGYAKMAAGAARAGVQPTAENLVRQRRALARIVRASPALVDAATGLDHRLFGQNDPLEGQ